MRKHQKVILKMRYLRHIAKKLLVKLRIIGTYLNRTSFCARQKNTYHLSENQVKKANKLGFSADEYVIYQLDENNPADYLSEYERFRFRDALGRKAILLDNKVFFWLMFHHMLPMNEMFFYKSSGRMYPLSKRSEDVEPIEFLKAEGVLVFKLVDSGGGNGFHLFEWHDGDFFIDHAPAAQTDITALLNDEDNYILEKYCRQGDFENQIFPYSVNTIRIITVRHKDGSYSIANAFHRFGGSKSSCVDNRHSGGFCAKIDLESGILSAARTNSPQYMLDDNKQVIDYNKHPITKIQIEGQTVPNWEQIKERAIEFHRKIQFADINFVAWDFALTNHGVVVIEANASCGANLLQMWAGQRNGPVGAWLREWGYLQ